MTDPFIAREHLHAHPLEWNNKREFYICEACKMVGDGPSYDCNYCKLKFHGDCAIAPPTLPHPLFPMPYPLAGPQNYVVNPYLHGHGHGHGGPDWNSSAPHVVQPGPGLYWPEPQNYWAQATPGMSAGYGTPTPPPPCNVAWTGSTWGSAPAYAWPQPADLPYNPHAGAGWNYSTQVPPGGQAPSGPTVSGQAPPPPPYKPARNSIWGSAARWGFNIAMLAMGIADVATD